MPWKAKYDTPNGTGVAAMFRSGPSPTVPRAIATTSAICRETAATSITRARDQAYDGPEAEASTVRAMVNAMRCVKRTKAARRAANPAPPPTTAIRSPAAAAARALQPRGRQAPGSDRRCAALPDHQRHADGNGRDQDRNQDAEPDR